MLNLTENLSKTDGCGSLPLASGSAPFSTLDIYGLSFRLLVIAEDDREDDWLRNVCRQSGEMLANLSTAVTTDHETKADFIARVRGIICMQNVAVSHAPETSRKPQP